ncbi:MAG: DUF1934 domain-containing protein [Eubacteriales bacterium]|nr:DUF1934 domain-containing protein [Eubacteriales bacterium]
MDMRDITLKITGKQFDGDKLEDNMEFVTDGKIYYRNDATYLIYEESELSGMPGCKTSLKVKDKQVHMKRLGNEEVKGMSMDFEQGKRYRSFYETPYGSMDMEILTSKVENDLKPDGTGKVMIDYMISLGGSKEGRNSLEIEITH